MLIDSMISSLNIVYYISHHGFSFRLIGFSVVMLEAPCCCQFMDFIQPVSRFSERRTPFQKALIYGL